MKEGRLKAVVATSSLELVEAAAARRAALAGRVEARTAPDKPLDVLVQHLVTVALGGGFEADAFFDEVRAAASYSGLTREEFDWALAFVERGGDSLTAYPENHRVAFVDGLWRVPDRGIAKRHRLGVGTIVSDAAMQVKWLGGGSIGSIEESFIARLNPGDCFVFAGRLLEFVRVQEMTAYVRKATQTRDLMAEVLAQELELQRLGSTLQALQAMPLDLVELHAPSPLSLPLMVERLREQLSTEKLQDRLDRLLAEGEAALEAGEGAPATPPLPRRRASSRL